MGDPTVIAALIGLLGSLFGSFLGVVASARLTTYRIQQLEKKVQAHNNLIERMYIAERNIELIKHDVEELKKE